MSAGFQQAKPVPGPRGWPIVGNALQLSCELHKSCEKFANEYGDVFRIRIGSKDVVVLNGRDAIQQALVRQPIDFAGRPDLLSFQSYRNIIGENISMTDYSPSWKLHRKLAESTLRSFTAGKKRPVLEEKVVFEVEELVSFWTNNNPGEVVVQPCEHVKLSVSNVILSFLVGRRHELDNRQLLDFLAISHDFDAATAAGNPADFMPWLRHISRGLVTRFENVLHNYRNWLQPYIEEHERNHEEGSEKDILDHLITATTGSTSPEERESLEITKKLTQSTVYDFFGAGFDTVSSSISWAILYLVMYPEIQEKIYSELGRIVGRGRSPSLEDRRDLPFAQGFILEVLRHACVAPFTVPHSTTRDVVLGGKFNYGIPKDTVVFVNLHSVQHSTGTWGNPEVFDPRRFLTEDGLIDPNKTKESMAFGAGRRRCLGSELAQNELFLYVTNLVHRLNFAAEDKGSLTTDHLPGLTVRPMPYKVRLALRE